MEWVVGMSPREQDSTPRRGLQSFGRQPHTSQLKTLEAKTRISRIAIILPQDVFKNDMPSIEIRQEQASINTAFL